MTNKGTANGKHKLRQGHQCWELNQRRRAVWNYFRMLEELRKALPLFLAKCRAPHRRGYFQDTLLVVDSGRMCRGRVQRQTRFEKKTKTE